MSYFTPELTHIKRCLYLICNTTFIGGKDGGFFWVSQNQRKAPIIRTPTETSKIVRNIHTLFGPTKCFGPKLCGPNCFRPTIFWTKRFVGTKFLRPKFFLTQNFFQLKTSFDLNFFGLHCLDQTSFLTQKFLVPKFSCTQRFWTQNFQPQIFFNPKCFLPKIFFITRFIVLTHNILTFMRIL